MSSLSGFKRNNGSAETNKQKKKLREKVQKCKCVFPCLHSCRVLGWMWKKPREASLTYALLRAPLIYPLTSSHSLRFWQNLHTHSRQICEPVSQVLRTMLSFRIWWQRTLISVSKRYMITSEVQNKHLQVNVLLKPKYFLGLKYRQKDQKSIFILRLTYLWSSSF